MSEPFLLRIDEPEDHVLRQPLCRIRGWCAGPDYADIAQLELRIGDIMVPWQAQTRSDVAAKYGNLSVTGFIVDFDLGWYFYTIRSGEVSIMATLPHVGEMNLRFSLAAWCRRALSGRRIRCIMALASAKREISAGQSTGEPRCYFGATKTSEPLIIKSTSGTSGGAQETSWS